MALLVLQILNELAKIQFLNRIQKFNTNKCAQLGLQNLNELAKIQFLNRIQKFNTNKCAQLGLQNLNELAKIQFLNLIQKFNSKIQFNKRGGPRTKWTSLTQPRVCPRWFPLVPGLMWS